MDWFNLLARVVDDLSYWHYSKLPIASVTFFFAGGTSTRVVALDSPPHLSISCIGCRRNASTQNRLCAIIRGL